MEISPIGDVVLVTGAGRGIGFAVAKGFDREGLAVAVNDYDPTLAEDAVAKIRAAGGKAQAFPGDVSNADAVSAIVAAIREIFGPVDVLVNNAGISPKRDGMKMPVWEMDPSEWQAVVGVNLILPRQEPGASSASSVKPLEPFGLPLHLQTGV